MPSMFPVSAGPIRSEKTVLRNFWKSRVQIASNGAPRKITDGQIEEGVTSTLKSMAANGTQWGTRVMADETGLTQNAIVRIWHAFGLQPRRVENFNFSKTPQLV